MSTWVGVAVWAVVLTMWGFMIVYTINPGKSVLEHCQELGYKGTELAVCVSEKMKESQ